MSPDRALADRPWPRRAPLWAVLLLLLGVAQTLLVVLTLNYETERAQDQAEAVAAEAASALRRELLATVQSLQSLLWSDPPVPQWRVDAAEMLRARRDLLHLERRDEAMAPVEAVATPYGEAPFRFLPRAQMLAEADAACGNARRTASPQFSRSYFLPLGAGLGEEAIDVCVPLSGAAGGFMVATLSLGASLERALATIAPVPRHEISLVEGDGTRLVREGAVRGAGVYRADRVVDLPGVTLQLRADSA
ncbi:MAG: PAS domain-containing sensor histidine kinase, partial [Rubrivivax sp.]|nr:PAS domain-containing sensor histidine kinase [Rubrivivax sp.]